VRKRIEQREHRKLLLAQTEVRETRTRRQTQKPDYVYGNAFDSEDDADEYAYQEEDAQDEEFNEDDFLNFRDVPSGSRGHRATAAHGERRRSTRTATKVNANGKRESSSDSWSHWRGERRSSRLGGPEVQFDMEPPPKRARTEDSTMSANSAEAGPASTNGGVQNGLKLKKSGAAALKPTEIALEEIAGKKRSKFWVYAVEPIPNAPQTATTGEPLRNGATPFEINGHGGHSNGNGTYHYTPSPPRNENGRNMDFDRSLEGSLSPLDS